MEKVETHHHWSGWPGAYCLHCGSEDPMEIANADNEYDAWESTWRTEEARQRFEILSVCHAQPEALEKCPQCKGDAVKNWILEGKQPKQVELLEWASWFETAKRHVADETIGKSRVSTVFLGVDHNYSEDGPPLIFETLVFGGDLDEEMDRYSTWEEAEAGHKAMVERVRNLHEN